jgi:hypothetical protein
MGPTWQVTLLGLVAGGLILAAVLILISDRSSPESRERMRRLTLSSRGRLADGVITGADKEAIYYSYSISGVAYSASQDISKLCDHIAIEPERLIGAVWIKYSTRQPGSSIVISEKWSGLRQIKIEGDN